MARLIAIVVAVIFMCQFYFFGADFRSMNTFWMGRIDPTGVAVSPNGRYVYVSNGGQFTNNYLSVIDTSNNKVIDKIPIKIEPNGGLAVGRDGRDIYVTGSSDGILMIDTLTKATTTIFTGALSYDVAVSPDGHHIYVANEDNHTSRGSVAVIDTTTNSVTATIPTNTRPNGLTVSPDARHVYFTSLPQDRNVEKVDGTVSVLDTTSNKVIATVFVGLNPRGVAVSPDSRYVYVANGGGFASVGQIISNVPDGSLSVINAVTNTVIRTIPTGVGSDLVAFSPDGRRVYVTNDGSYIPVGDELAHAMAGTVLVVDTATCSPIDNFALDGVYPSGAAISPDDHFIYVAVSDSRDVLVIDAAAGIRAASILSGHEGIVPKIQGWIEPVDLG